MADLQEKFGISDVGDPIYRELARSMAISFLEIDETNAQEMGKTEAELRGIAEQVNRMLRDHLFRERGYRLDAEMRFLLSPKDYAEVAGGQAKHKVPVVDYPMLLRLFLVDSASRRFNFDEVGSGLGYVLPVLAVLFSSRNGVLIQQPELHLHPALQAELGDVFIEAHHGNSNPIIVETHSEHLLLRILRRVRRTYRGQQVEPELQVRSSDISVLYFDPTLNGVTHVKQLRISEDGEFIDRWPKGFFAERDKELFDE